MASFLSKLFGMGKEDPASSSAEAGAQAMREAFHKPAEDGPLDYTIEVRDLPEQGGMEIVVSLVNESEEPVRLKGAVVGVEVDHKSKGVHDLTFPNAAKDGHLVLEQFEIAEGHFFMKKYTDYQHIRTKVFVEYESHDQVGREAVSQRLSTRQFRKKS